MSDWEFLEHMQSWHNKATKQTLTHEQLSHMTQSEVDALMPNSGFVQTAPRQAGKATASGRATGGPAPLTRPLDPSRILNGTVISFETHSRYTYVALYRMGPRSLEDLWYISGSGSWFGTNMLTNDQMSEVLMRDTTSAIRILESTGKNAYALLFAYP